MAFLLSIALYSWLTQTDLAADIKGATWTDNTVITDMFVSVEEDNLVITAWKNIPDVASVSILFVYDAETVKRSDDWVVSSYDVAVSAWEKWEATVVVPVGGQLDKDSEILEIRVNWSPYDIIVADVVATFSDDSVSPLTLTMP